MVRQGEARPYRFKFNPLWFRWGGLSDIAPDDLRELGFHDDAGLVIVYIAAYAVKLGFGSISKLGFGKAGTAVVSTDKLFGTIIGGANAMAFFVAVETGYRVGAQCGVVDYVAQTLLFDISPTGLARLCLGGGADGGEGNGEGG